MKNIREQLAEIGVVNPTEIYYNLSYDELYEHETKPGLTGFDRAFFTKNGALSVDTGIFTGRSPKDKYVVYDNPFIFFHTNKLVSPGIILGVALRYTTICQ